MFDRETLLRDVSVALAKITPPAAVSAASATEGWDAHKWVYILTAGYIVLQAAHLLWKWWREAKKP